MLEIIQTGYNGIKGALDIAQGISALKTEAAVNQAVIEIQRLLLDAQRALTEADTVHSADTKRMNDLEQEIVRLKDWSRERESYELKAIERSAFAYMHKAAMEEGQTPHWLCANCFEQGHKSHLQLRDAVDIPGLSGSQVRFCCARCASCVAVSSRNYPGRMPQQA